jgi:hypothetical protein
LKGAKKDLAAQIVEPSSQPNKATGRAKRQEVPAPVGKSLPERQRELIDFYEQYEDLVEALCDAARFGPDIVLERRYFEARTRIRADYPALRPFLISYLDFQPEDAIAGLKLCGRPVDAFEALVAAFDLQEFFKLDDGNMIFRITRTREALNAYGEHLRQLAAKAA